MSDHGNIGIFGFPSETLYADDINAALKTMHEKKMYKELAFYMLACHSGSYFDQGQLPENINIYAISSATRHQSTLCEYCPPNDVVKGKSIGTCLSDQFSAAWMEDADTAKDSRTFAQQWHIINKRMTYSQSLKFGDQSIAKQSIWNFMGAKKSNSVRNIFDNLFLNDELVTDEAPVSDPSGIKPTDKRLNHLYYKVIRNGGGHKAELDLMEELNHRIRVDHTFSSFDYYLNLADVSDETTNYDCLRALVGTYEKHCGVFRDYVFEKAPSLVKACNTANSLADMQKTLEESCHH
jgi:legumain